MTLLLMIALCFAGLFCMFFFLLRGQENMLKSLRHEIEQNRTQLQIIEARLASLCDDDTDILPNIVSKNTPTSSHISEKKTQQVTRPHTQLPTVQSLYDNVQNLESLSFETTDTKGGLSMELPRPTPQKGRKPL